MSEHTVSVEGVVGTVVELFEQECIEGNEVASAEDSELEGTGPNTVTCTPKFEDSHWRSASFDFIREQTPWYVHNVESAGNEPTVVFKRTDAPAEVPTVELFKTECVEKHVTNWEEATEVWARADTVVAVAPSRSDAGWFDHEFEYIREQSPWHVYNVESGEHGPVVVLEREE